jgi:hypothetical protein
LLATLTRYPSVHRVRRQIDFAGPCDRAEIDIDAVEELHVSQWRFGARKK